MRDDFAGFFRLMRHVREYERTQHRGEHPCLLFLMNRLVLTVRQRALRRIFKAYRPSVSVQFLTDTLHFTNPEACIQMLLDLDHVV